MLAGGIRRAIVACSSFGIGSCLALAGTSACSFNTSGNSRGVGVLQEADDEVGHADDDDSSPEPEPEPEPEPGDDDATRTDDGSASADDRGDASDATEGNHAYDEPLVPTKRRQVAGDAQPSSGWSSWRGRRSPTLKLIRWPVSGQLSR